MSDLSQPVRPLLPADDDDDIGRPTRATWMMLISLVIAKAGTIAIVLAIDFSSLAALFVTITTWFWILAGVVLLSGPVAFAFRLRRVRSRRKQLQQAEWMLS